jgi:hypothetical protein
LDGGRIIGVEAVKDSSPNAHYDLLWHGGFIGKCVMDSATKKPPYQNFNDNGQAIQFFRSSLALDCR